MPDDSAYRKILRLIGSVPVHLRGRLERKDEYLVENGRWFFKELVKSSHGKNNSFRIFSLKELQKATNNFSADQIWYNYYTYIGTIEGKLVAVKISGVNQVVSLSVIKHRNVVKLLGCCLETYYPTAVHELPPNGTLEENISKLSWTDRLIIATEIADAVAYLHSELHMTHGLLWNAEAVLLDEFHSAKLSAFDCSMIQNQDKSSDAFSDDVSQFGKILLNLLGIQRDDRSKLRDCKGKVEILKYLKVNVLEKEMPHTEAYIDLLLRCRAREDELSMEEVARELRRIRSVINHQPTADENQSDNISSGANASTSYQEAKSYY